MSNTLPADSYVVTRSHYLNPAVTYAAFGWNISLSKRAADQLKKGFAKIDKRFKDAKVVQRKTAQKRGVFGV